jgi:maleylacetoacetate isomerase
MTASLTLHGFFNSSASYRVRIALNLKGLEWAHVGVNIRAGEQSAEAYRRLNPAALVPTLHHDGYALTQSMVIIDYLDRLQPMPLLVPRDGAERDRALEIASLVACDIHPINNLRVLRYLGDSLGFTDAQRRAWMAHWIEIGFDAIEALVSDGAWCVGQAPSIADCCLIPQVANARRAGVDISRWPRIASLDRHASGVPAFADAAPERQPDFIAA